MSLQLFRFKKANNSFRFGSSNEEFTTFTRRSKEQTQQKKFIEVSVTAT